MRRKFGKLLGSELSQRRAYTRSEFTLYKKSEMRKSLPPVQSDAQRKTNTWNLSNKSLLTTDCIPKPVLTFALGIVVITITVGFKWLALHGFTKNTMPKGKKMPKIFLFLTTLSDFMYGVWSSLKHNVLK